jgi:hypothetical protein
VLLLRQKQAARASHVWRRNARPVDLMTACSLLWSSANRIINITIVLFWQVETESKTEIRTQDENSRPKFKRQVRVLRTELREPDGETLGESDSAQLEAATPRVI